MSATGLVRIERRKASSAGLLPKAEAARWRAIRPHFAHLYVENKCNLRCDHCYESEETHPTHLRLSLEDYDRILEELARLGVLVVTFSGGEPFLRRDFLDIVALARKKRFHVRIYTSGTLLDERKADRLAALRVGEVHVSVYSHDPEVHDRFTGIPGSHAKSLRAIRLLRERGIQTVMKTNVLTFNVDSLDDIVALARSLDTQVQLAPEVYRRNSGDTAPQQYMVPSEELAAKFHGRPDLAAAFSDLTPEAICTGEGRWSSSPGLCSAASRLITIGADGGVYACTMFPVAAGNAFAEGIAETWFRSRLFDEIRRTRFGDMHDCPSCELRSACSPCMAYGYIERGDHRACNSTSRNLAESVYQVAQRRLAAERKLSRGRPLPVVGERRAQSPLDDAVATVPAQLL